MKGKFDEVIKDQSHPVSGSKWEIFRMFSLGTGPDFDYFALKYDEKAILFGQKIDLLFEVNVRSRK